MSDSLPGTPEPEAVGRAARWKPSIAVALTIGLSALLALVAGAVLLIGLLTAESNTTTLLRQLSDLAIRTVEERVNQHINAAENQVRAIAHMIETGALDPENDTAVVEAMISAMAVVPQTHALALIRPDRPILAVGIPKGHATPRRFELDLGEATSAQALLADAQAKDLEGWRDVVYLEPLDQPGMMVHGAIGSEKTFAGVVTSMISIFELSGFLETLELGNGARAFILHGRDRVLAHPELDHDHPGIDEETLLPDLETYGDPVLARIWDTPERVFDQVLSDTKTQGHHIEGEDEGHVFLFREIFGAGEAPWYVGVYLPASETNKTYNRVIAAGVAAGALILVAVVLVFLLGRYMARPIRELAEASNAITRFEIGATKPLPGSLFRELDSASKAYNSMTGGLKLFSTYVPQQLVLRLMRLGPEGARLERREVSVMFTDIAGFTRLAGELEADELAAFLNHHFALQAEAIDAEGGIIDKYIGDSIMAFWGAPEDQPDHAARAVRAAIRMADTIAEENRRREGEARPYIGVRIGVHSGPAVAGNIGAPGRINYTLVGDTVNVAQRLEGLGREIDPDAPVILMISADCAEALPADLKAELDLESLGERELRGRAEQIAVFRVRRKS